MKHYQQKPNKKVNCLDQRFIKMSQNQKSCAFTKDELLQLIDHYEFENFHEKALDVIEYGITFFQNTPSFKVRKTRILLYHYHYKLAMEVLDKKQSKALSPSQHDLLSLEILIVQKQFNEALEMIDELKDIYGKTRKILSDVFFLESIVLEKQKSYDKSFGALSEALWINYNHKDALGKIWMVTELAKKWEESVLLHEYLLKKEHYSAMTWFNLGHAYYGQNEYEKAIEAFNWCIIIDEKFEPAYSDLAEVLEIEQRYSEAAEILHKAILDFDIDEVDSYLKCGECFVRAEQLTQAVEILEKGILVFDDPDLWFWLGEAYQMQNKFDESIEKYQQVLEVADGRDDAHNSIGISQFYLGNYFEAEDHFFKAIELAPFEASYRTSLASLYLNIGELQKSEDTLTEATCEVPNIELCYHLAAILILNGKRKRGLDMLKKSLEFNVNMVHEFFNFAGELDRPDKEIDLMIQYYHPNYTRN